MATTALLSTDQEHRRDCLRHFVHKNVHRIDSNVSWRLIFCSTSLEL